MEEVKWTDANLDQPWFECCQLLPADSFFMSLVN